MGRPRLAVAFVLFVLTTVVGAHLYARRIEMQPPRNDQATLAELRSRFADKAWAANLASAYWNSSQQTLTVSLTSEDRRCYRR